MDLPIGEGISAAVDFMLEHFQGVFDFFAAILKFLTGGLTDLLGWLPAWVVIVVLAGLALWRVGWKFALFVVAALGVVLGMQLWEQTMETLALVLAAAIVALGLGLPLGVAMAKSDLVAAVLRPVLDFMQTLPAFVYLIPAAMFFGLGQVPGAIATVIFSMPPSVRLMNLGIRHVDVENVEAGRAFGCNPFQLLFKVELPLAMPSIMAGINQTIMLGLSMVVIASMIGAGGLGNTVLTGIQRLDVGLGFEGGLGVVVLAIILDRLTQSFGQAGRKDSPLERLKKLFGGEGSERTPT
ncbi:glycine betaine/L-proline ABC transporter permease [Alcanivorax sp. 521-1]|uniref:Glycine betaine/L-proline ABC transporter permease n=1 Tax=Alloalcanivorax profundimaris TaxID=2735259 RepID=A0ABS0ATG5_9GAMM|nr:proline/glycine betaine ABC transporter permease [Alloalcanivorax profundimaris]MAO59306.1 glycine/betaine ABC transporter [Alcanivorax sp.]MAY11457.1 glycine/betaine ABC transporter [Alcanivorax sp.]MBF5057410.1 glycine betaine/L-proline ABC transporter permease [Alloalcanivorax profundimaris]MBI54492.1 glycine/betaine ABC transporter [Alcanivorax sp.]HCE40502.1 glycine/betaine ABC transporter [Alcanivorax sp.]|tara:strand:- start:11538 stop:12425 length:888 start_codon:yes stop_codon:yes gene_type:complete